MLDEFRLAIRSDAHYLCIGSDASDVIKDSFTGLFDRPVYFITLQGASDEGLYCYSLLPNCRGVLLITAWANIASVATTKYFHHWIKILDELSMIGCQMIFLDTPIKQPKYRHPTTKEGISTETLIERRAIYRQKVIEPFTRQHMVYIDIADIVGYDPACLVDAHPTETPWHLNRQTIKKIVRYFVRTVVAGPDKSIELSI